ncbi:MAG: hypothetical protein ABIR91_04190 [Candidatus Saccharimonadales bacterium]
MQHRYELSNGDTFTATEKTKTDLGKLGLNDVDCDEVIASMALTAEELCQSDAE